jgi:hypothetical protein
VGDSDASPICSTVRISASLDGRCHEHLMRERNYLFSTNHLSLVLSAQLEKVFQEIEALDADRFLASSADAVTDHFEDRHRIEPIVLHEDRCEVSQHETNVDVSRDPDRFFRGPGPHCIKGAKYVLHVPYSGDAELFKYRPSSYTTSPPSGDIEGSELHLSVTTAGQDGSQIQAELDSQLASLRIMVVGVANDVARFNGELRPAIRQRVEQRRAKILADQNTTASLKFPIRKRAGQAEHIPVPVTRKTIRPLPTVPRGSQFKPEHAVSMEEYEEILNCIGSMAVAMERSPSSFAHMHEEQVRDFFLVLLNSQFEGAATGETFNFSGKTDILIRVEARNVFIAECKFWHGEKAFVEAIDQLLGYACWRDTKLALLVFNRNKNLTAVIEKIAACLRAHPNFLRIGAARHETSVRCALQHRDDPARELTLTVLVFEMPLDGSTSPAPSE